jgi:23S rRNA (cytosine1962-C5)-methyltransferase
LASGKRVLNLFCYTGSFSVYAADGGAALVTSVDLSNTYLDWARRNFTLNKFSDESKYAFVKSDVLQYMHQLRPNSYDMIILDPPTFSNSKMMKDFLDVQRDHVMLINTLIKALSPGGLLFFSTNYRKFQLEQDQLKAVTVKDITRSTTPFDFRDKLQRFCFQINI